MRLAAGAIAGAIIGGIVGGGPFAVLGGLQIRAPCCRLRFSRPVAFAAWNQGGSTRKRRPFLLFRALPCVYLAGKGKP